MKTKYLFKSKTIIFNLLVSIAGVVAFFYQPANEWVQENAVLILAVVGAANMLLRRATKDAYAFFPVLVALMMLPSCTPSAYEADLTTYGPVIEADASKVTLKPEHVTPIGNGFSGLDFTGSIVTDFGTISTDGDNVDISIDPVVIDTRSGK